MLTQRAAQLKPGDTFTSNDGVDWHTVHSVTIVKQVFSDADAVLFTTEEHEKIWLWSSEEVVVRL